MPGIQYTLGATLQKNTYLYRMNFPLRTSWRYIFSKKNTNAIHIISIITVFGIAVGTAALLLVLSVFNGFEKLLGELFGYFNPAVKIELKEGKFFQIDTTQLAQLRAIDGISQVSVTLEEVAFFEFDGSQDFGTIKGVDNYFHQINHLDSTIIDGEYLLEADGNNYLVVGAGLAAKLSLNGVDPFKAISIYMPVDKKRSSIGKPFRSRLASTGGIFQIQDEVDMRYALSNLEFVRELLKLPDMASAIEIGITDHANLKTIKPQLAQILGNDYTYKDRYEQNEAFFKIMKLERWMYFAIISLAMILVAFNMVGSLWMTVLEKKSDIALLRSIGLEDKGVFTIFFFQGIFLLTLGILGGFVIALGLYYLHQSYGLIDIPAGFAIDRYPLELNLLDFPIVAFTVFAIGSVASFFPAKKALAILPTDIRR